jgi:hypothetical protein
MEVKKMETYVVRILDIKAMSEIEVEAEDSEDAEAKAVELLADNKIVFNKTKIGYYVHPAKLSDLREDRDRTIEMNEEDENVSE